MTAWRLIILNIGYYKFCVPRKSGFCMPHSMTLFRASNLILQHAEPISNSGRFGLVTLATQSASVLPFAILCYMPVGQALKTAGWNCASFNPANDPPNCYFPEMKKLARCILRYSDNG